jgi:hypothetical protein
MAKLKEISKSHFAILGMARLHFVNQIYEEREWWADEDERVIGVVVFDKIDDDWSYMVLGRDETGLFRGMDQGIELPSQASARANLKERLAHYSDSGAQVFPQADETEERKEILRPVVPVEQLHSDFRHLIDDPQYSAARRVIEETAYAFVDVDGNYIRDFQTTGFPGRLWELYLFRFLYEQEFFLHREFKRPDYCASQGNFRIGIEAVTVNPTAGEAAPVPKSNKEIKSLLDGYMPIKFGSSLYSKLQKKYWEDEHMQDAPLTIAIHDFHAGNSMIWSAPALHEYLYGVRLSIERDASGAPIERQEPIAEHVWKEKRILSGFFSQPDAEHISAVLFSNASTLSKWNRMGRMAGFGDPDTIMYRRGFKENPDPDALEPVGFSVEVKHGTYEESWSEDIRVFHNPNAIRPLPMNLFQDCSNMFFRDGKFYSAEPPGNYIITSTTFVFSATRD